MQAAPPVVEETPASLPPPPAALPLAPAPANAQVPKKKAIRLPFHVSYLPNDAVAKTQRICGICRTNPSPYACPRCQVPYCSLACYQNTERHAQCSEPFYKEEITLEIASQGKPTDAPGPGKSKEEQNKMLDMLRRFEEGANEDGPLEWDGDEPASGEEPGDGLDELAELLETAGLDGVPPEELLAMLPAEMRSQFLSSVASSSNQPSSIIQSLLESDELRNEEHSPWWLAAEPEAPMDLDIPLEAVQIPKASTRSPPEMVAIPAAVRPTLEAARRVLFNVVAVAIAYIHTTLTFRRSPLAEALPREGKLSGLALEDARAMLDHLLSLVPFAEEPKSTVLLSSVKEARLYTSSHLEASSALPSKVLSAHILQLLKPPSPVLETDAAQDPHPLCLALSDVHRLLVLTASPTTRTAHRRIQKKLEFYAASVAAWTRIDWQQAVAQVDKMIERELLEAETDDSFAADAPPLSRTEPEEPTGQRRIQELDADVGGSLPLSSITEIIDDDAETARLDP